MSTSTVAMPMSMAFRRFRHTLRRAGRRSRRANPGSSLAPVQRVEWADASGAGVGHAHARFGGHVRLNRHTMALAAMLIRIVMMNSTTPMPTRAWMCSPVASEKVLAMTAAIL